MHKISIFEFNRIPLLMLKNLLPALVFLIVQSTYSQYTEVINSNRPGVSKAAFSVGTNVLQFELGPYIVNEEHTPLQYEVSGFGADFSVRYGLFFEQLEVNIEGIYQNDTFTNNISTIPQQASRSNFKNLAIGAKYLIYDPYKNSDDDKPNLYSYHANRGFKWKDLIPAVAIYGGANFDTPDNPYTGPGVEGFSPKAMVATQNNFSNGWVLVTNLVFDRIGTDFPEFQYLITATYSFSPQWVVFGETQGIKGDFYADNLFRVGGAYLWTRDFQLDTAITFNTKDTPSIFNVNIGASYRFDFHEDKPIDNGGDIKTERKKKRKGKRRKRDFDDNDDDGSL